MVEFCYRPNDEKNQCKEEEWLFMRQTGKDVLLKWCASLHITCIYFIRLQNDTISGHVLIEWVYSDCVDVI